jgi:putative nucleotidyltransferase with HDIG domain
MLGVLYGAFATLEEIWVVGGAVREIVSGRVSVDDLDLALRSGAIPTARELAERLEGAFVLLDSERGAARVAFREGKGIRQIDLTDFRAPSLEEDLRGRDFTANALAVSLHALVREGRAPVVDPTGGLEDLTRRRLRMASASSLSDDPARALRGVRIALECGLGIEPATRAAIRKAAQRLAEVSPERLRDEWIALLSLRKSAAALREMDRLGLLRAVLPEAEAMKETAQPPPHRFTVWEHSLKTVEAVEMLLPRLDALDPFGDDLACHLAEPLGDNCTRRETLKLAALLHDVAKPRTRSVAGGEVHFIGHESLGAEMAGAACSRWRLAGRASRVVEKLVRHHLRPMHLANAGELTRRARYRFFRDLESEAQDLLLLALADAAAVRGVSPLRVWGGPGGALARELFSGWEDDWASVAAPPLIRGEDVMEAFGLSPGPEVGRLLALAREAHALGQVSTRAEALAFLAEVVKIGTTRA